jgi:predicted dithiol-disulfide oxidoreductase (DUF899 family)
MSLPKVVSRDEWVAARVELLAKEKELTRQRDALSTERRNPDESIAPGQYNFRSKAEFEAAGSDFFQSDQPFEMPGRSCFLQVDGRVYHTYSQYARGLESTGGSYYFLDLTALGRQEEWEEPKGRSELPRAAQPDFGS